MQLCLQKIDEIKSSLSNYGLFAGKDFNFIFKYIYIFDFMRSTVLALLIFVILISFFSCQKELGVPVDPVNLPPGRLLVKVTGVKGDSSIITTYTYDALDRITSREVTQTYPKNTSINFRKYYRDISGRIFVIANILKNNSSVSDTLYTHVTYANSQSTIISHTITRIGVMGITATDSTVYTYNSDGNISSISSYLISNTQINSSILNSRCEYFYDSNTNLVEQKAFAYVGGNSVPVAAYKFLYDQNISPLPTGNEFILSKVEGNGSKNNLNSIEMTDVKNPVNNSVITRTYSLNKAGKPEKCYEKLSSDSSYTYSYFYQ